MSTASSALAGAGRLASPLGLSWPLLVGALAFLIGLDGRLLLDADTYWHLATARWMFEHFAIPSVDPFSHSMRGAPWVAHEWLAEVLLGAAWEIAGWAGPVALAAAAYGAAMALLCRYLLRYLEPLYALVLVVLALAMVEQHLLARPHALALPLVTAWAVLLLEARAAERAPAWPGAALMVLWANLHGSFALGLGLAAWFGFEAVVSAPRPQRLAVLRAWSGFLLLALLAALLTPHGWRGLAFAAQLHDMSYTLANLDEWRSPDFQRYQPLEVGLMAVALAILLRGLRLPLLRAVLLLGLLHLALKHARHGEILGLLAPLLLAAPMGRQWGGGQRNDWRAPLPAAEATAEAGGGAVPPPPAGASWTAALDRRFAALALPARPAATVAMLLLLLLPAWLLAQAGVLRPAPLMTPAAALRAVEAARPAGQVFNDYHFGGYLIFSGIPPYIDGRADLYGDAFVADTLRAIRLEAPERLPAILGRPEIGWTLLAPGQPAVALLDRLPGWRRLHADATAVVHVKTSRQ